MATARKKDTGVVDIHGKDYLTVAHRMQVFRAENPGFSIVTSVLSVDDTSVLMRAEIRDAADRIVSTGHAEEVRASSSINRSAALENAETSAVGRALSFYRYAGTEIASADEIAAAINRPARPLPPKERIAAFLKEHGIDGAWARSAMASAYGKPLEKLTDGDWKLAASDRELSGLLDAWNAREAKAS